MNVIAGDVGGTKTLLQLVEIVDGESTVALEHRFDSGGYKTFDELLGEFLGMAKRTVDAACFAGAGPAVEDRAGGTNPGRGVGTAGVKAGCGMTPRGPGHDCFWRALAVPLVAADI